MTPRGCATARARSRRGRGSKTRATTRATTRTAGPPEARPAARPEARLEEGRPGRLDPLQELLGHLVDESRRQRRPGRRTIGAGSRFPGTASAAPASCRRSTAGVPPRARPRPRSTASAGNSPSSRPAMKTTGNSRPFALCNVIIITRASAEPSSSSVSDSSDRRSTKPPSVAPGSRNSYSFAADTSSARFSTRLSESSVRSSRSADRYPDLSSTLAIATETGSCRAAAIRPTIRSRNTFQRRGGAAGERAAIEPADQARPQRVRRQALLGRQPKSGRRGGERVHHALPDARAAR